MSITTQTSLVGFIATAPELHFTQSGIECCRLRVGVEHYRKEIDGSLTTLDPTFHDLVSFEKTARETYDRFRVGDCFVASGHVREYEVSHPDGSIIKEEFVARKIGHDANRTQYAVERRRRPAVEPTTGPTVGPSVGPSIEAPAAAPTPPGHAVGL